MEYPTTSQSVLVTTDTGEVEEAGWDGEKWMQGVDDNPKNQPYTKNVISWKPL